ncbi:Bifunctional purine biosynthetic protein ade1 [Kalmusia sp. IMI 367209]|nr:Bifunctional purine biosynthetic protein ade1 [Kalmusia sp. IMI 367209]
MACSPLPAIADWRIEATAVDVPLYNVLAKIATGKVRDLYVVDADALLFVSSDRISAYDVNLVNGIPLKGIILTAMSIYWFRYLEERIPALKIHFLAQNLPPQLDEARTLNQAYADSLRARSMVVKRVEILPIESIVRGYLAGSAWIEYQKSSTVHGIALPTGMVEGQKLPHPIWTPSTKAAAGEKDENITPQQARAIIGNEHISAQVETLSLEVYKCAAKRCEEVGMILADTKLEWGLDGSDSIVLADEVLTPDSSRFWPMATYEAHLGRAQPSYDKQFLRDWLVSSGLKGVQGVTIPDEIVTQTSEKYQEVFQKLTERPVTDVLP